MAANDKKSYLCYLNKIVDECNNTYHCSITKKPIDANYSALTEIRQILKLLNLKLVIESWLLSMIMFLAKFSPITGRGKTNPCAYKIKDLNGETTTGSF